MTKGSKMPLGAAQRLAALALFGAVAVIPQVAVSDGGAEHQTWVRPVELGVSGSSIEHVVDGQRLFCYTGTLGALVTDGPNDYFLSNNHVLAKENEPNYDDTVLPADGYDIIQPGLLDEGPCSLSSGDSANVVAQLSHYVPLGFGKRNSAPTATADVAIAEVTTNDVVADGAIRDIGPLTGDSVTATPTMLVQKSGRTTGHTLGEVVANNVSLNVQYQSGYVHYDNQIEIVGVCGTDFSAGGDSGSLIVNLVDGNLRSAVGLLFAGGGSSTFANPIDTALAALSSEGGAPTVTLVIGGAGTVNDVTANAAGLTCSPPDDDGGSGKGGGPGNGGGPGGGRPGGAGSFAGGVDPLGLEIAAEVAADHSAELFAIPGVVGHGTGVDANGDPVIRVYVESARREAGNPIPRDLEGYAVQIVVTGPIQAY